MKHTPFGLKDNNCICTYNFTCRVCLDACLGISPREDKKEEPPCVESGIQLTESEYEVLPEMLE